MIISLISDNSLTFGRLWIYLIFLEYWICCHCKCRMNLTYIFFPSLEIPVFPTVTAKVTFTSFDWRDDIDSSMFVIPQHYREKPDRFSDLWQMMDISIMDIFSSLRNVILVEEFPEDPGSGYLELAVGMEVPLTNLGISSTEMTLLF